MSLKAFKKLLWLRSRIIVIDMIKGKALILQRLASPSLPARAHVRRQTVSKLVVPVRRYLCLSKRYLTNIESFTPLL